jgi:hypothetical protein
MQHTFRKLGNCSILARSSEDEDTETAELRSADHILSKRGERQHQQSVTRFLMLGDIVSTIEAARS